MLTWLCTPYPTHLVSMSGSFSCVGLGIHTYIKYPKHITAYQHKIIEFIYGFCHTHTFSFLFVHTYANTVVWHWHSSISIQAIRRRDVTIILRAMHFCIAFWCCMPMHAASATCMIRLLIHTHALTYTLELRIHFNLMNVKVE